MSDYQQSLKTYRDLKGVLDTSFLEGKLEGELMGIEKGKIEGKIEGNLEGKLETAKNLKKLGVNTRIISESTGMAVEEIEKL